MIENNTCPACARNCRPSLYYRSREWKVVRCPHCTFAWLIDLENPQRTGFGWGMDIVRESEKRVKMYEDRLRRIERFRPVSRSWLDVGCGGGGFLSVAAAAGYEVEGVDPSPAAEIASSLYGISVCKGDLPTSIKELSRREYGVISYYHVLEHVYDPFSELQTARELMHRDGLLIIEVPFFDTVAWKLLRSKHRHFWRGHRSYFNQKSISALVNRARFAIIELDRVPYYMTLDWLLMRLGSPFKELRAIMPSVLLNRAVRIDLGDILLTIACKKSEPRPTHRESIGV